MTYDLFKNLYRNTFIFDLEYIGYTTDLKQCYIWEIGAIHLASKMTFKITIDPQIRPLPKAFSPDFCNVTTELLEERRAVSFETAWKMLTDWVDRFGQPVLWISHNCFKADKIVMEAETHRHGIRMPLNWFFFDSLIFCRYVRPKMASYTLGDLYQSVCFKKIYNAHDALSDAYTLMEILLTVGVSKMEGPIYSAYSTSLQVVKWLGPSCEKILFSQNIRSLEQLKQVLVTEYALQSLNLTMNLRSYITLKLNSYGIKTGNAMSITNSIMERWI